MFKSQRKGAGDKERERNKLNPVQSIMGCVTLLYNTTQGSASTCPMIKILRWGISFHFQTACSKNSVTEACHPSPVSVLLLQGLKPKRDHSPQVRSDPCAQEKWPIISTSTFTTEAGLQAVLPCLWHLQFRWTNTLCTSNKTMLNKTDSLPSRASQWSGGDRHEQV